MDAPLLVNPAQVAPGIPLCATCPMLELCLKWPLRLTCSSDRQPQILAR